MIAARTGRARPMRVIVAAALVTLAAAGAARAKDKEEAGAPLSLPFFLKGIDINQPAQAAFFSWPGKELEERPYWLPWTPLTLQRATIFNQPVFLVVTVPWSRPAQVMTESTLADPAVLRALNHDFISVLVSADRRPDIYARYGTGSWPAISLLLPDGSPMLSQANERGVALPITFGATDKNGVLFNLTEGRKYFDRWQTVLRGVSDLYEKRVDLEDPKSGVVAETAIEPVVRWLAGNVDGKNGGFGAAPKYALPGLMEWAFLREDENRLGLVAPARATLVKMSASPLFDKRDGGFHRMAAAPDWGAIQYEKMLSANTDLIRDMVFALREEDDPALRAALTATARFVTTALARPDGGFYLGQIADPTSADGGAYWTAAEGSATTAPPIDKLVLSGPNALAGAALLRAGAVLDNAAVTQAGRAALDLVVAKAVVPGRGVAHVVEADLDPNRYLATQTQVAFGLLDGYESTGEARYLAAAKDIAEFVRNNMRSSGEATFRDHLPLGHEFGLLDMPLRPMTDNARLARVFVRLQVQGAVPDGRTLAEQVLGAYTGDLASYGVRAIEPALAVDETLGEALIVTIEGKGSDPAVTALRRAALNLRRGFVVIRTGSGETPAATLAWHGLTRRATQAADLPGQLKSLVEAAAAAP